MSTTAKVNRHDIRKIIHDNFNDTDLRFSNDDILEYLSQVEKYRGAGLDVLDLEDILLELEATGMLRPIAQNFNTRYFKLWNRMEVTKCPACGMETFFAPPEEGKTCPNCNAKI